MCTYVSLITLWLLLWQTAVTLANSTSSKIKHFIYRDNSLGDLKDIYLFISIFSILIFNYFFTQMTFCTFEL